MVTSEFADRRTGPLAREPTPASRSPRRARPMTLAQLFFAKHPRQTPARRPRRPKRSPRRRRLLFEPLEPRPPLSADPSLPPLSAPALGPELALRLDPQTETLQVVDSQTGVVVTQRPVGETAGVVVTGTDGDDRLTVDASAAGAVPITFLGGAGPHTPVGPAADSTWTHTRRG